MPCSEFFKFWALSQLFHSPLSPSSRGASVSLWFLLLECICMSELVEGRVLCSVYLLCHFKLCVTPMDCSPPDSSVLGNSPGQNTGVGCHALLQGRGEYHKVIEFLVIVNGIPMNFFRLTIESLSIIILEPLNNILSMLCYKFLSSKRWLVISASHQLRNIHHLTEEKSLKAHQ